MESESPTAIEIIDTTREEGELSEDGEIIEVSDDVVCVEIEDGAETRENRDDCDNKRQRSDQPRGSSKVSPRKNRTKSKHKSPERDSGRYKSSRPRDNRTRRPLTPPRRRSRSRSRERYLRNRELTRTSQQTSQGRETWQERQRNRGIFRRTAPFNRTGGRLTKSRTSPPAPDQKTETLIGMTKLGSIAKTYQNLPNGDIASNSDRINSTTPGIHIPVEKSAGSGDAGVQGPQVPNISDILPNCPPQAPVVPLLDLIVHPPPPPPPLPPPLPSSPPPDVHPPPPPPPSIDRLSPKFRGNYRRPRKPIRKPRSILEAETEFVKRKAIVWLKKYCL